MPDLFQLRVDVRLDVKDNIRRVVRIIFVRSRSNELDIATIKGIANANGNAGGSR